MVHVLLLALHDMMQPVTWHVSANTVCEAYDTALLVPVPDCADAMQRALYTHPVVFMERIYFTFSCSQNNLQLE